MKSNYLQPLREALITASNLVASHNENAVEISNATFLKTFRAYVTQERNNFNRNQRRQNRNVN